MSKRPLVQEIAAEIRLLQQSFDAFDEAVAGRLGINRTDLRALDTVLAHQRIAAGELASALAMSPAATTTVIDRLERAGFVVRARDAQNRRRVMVSPTERARAVERDLYLPLGAAGAQALSGYDEAELDIILGFLRTAGRVQQEHTERIRHAP